MRARQRTSRARELLAQARQDYRTQQYLCCLDRCELLADAYADTEEAKEATELAAKIKDNPEWARRACDQMGDRPRRSITACLDDLNRDRTGTRRSKMPTHLRI